jgi:uncharacterized protein (TIGR03437 family)
MTPLARWVLGIVACPLAVLAQPVVTGVANGASFDTTASPGCIVSIFGTSLARSTLAASSLPLPRTLAGTVVRVGTQEAPLYYVSPGQINIQLPFEVAPGTVSLSVTTPDGTSRPWTLEVTAVAPAIFLLNPAEPGKALYFNSRFEIAPPVAPGDGVILYAVGLGRTEPPVASGAGGATAEPLSRLNPLPEVFIGRSKGSVAFAGMAPGFAGVYQLNVVVPELSGDSIEIRTGGRSSKKLRVGVRGGVNASDVSGNIEILYPKPTTKVGFSPILIVFRYSVRMNVLPSAGAFSVAVEVDGVDQLSKVDLQPQEGSFQANVLVPTSRSRSWDFSGTEINTIDYLAGGLPTPGNIIPASRADPEAQRALQELPLPNQPIAGSSMGFVVSQGAAQPGSTFVIDQQNNPTAGASGVYLQSPYSATNKQRTARVTIYVEGKPVVSQEVTFQAF